MSKTNIISGVPTKTHHKPSMLLKPYRPKNAKLLIADEYQSHVRTKHLQNVSEMNVHYRDKIVREMKLRDLSVKTQEVYLQCLKLFMSRFKGKNPKTLTIEEIENYILELMERKQSRRYINMQIISIRFFYKFICAPSFNIEDLPRLKERRKLPKVFTRDEVMQIIEGAANIKRKCMLAMLYSTGMRAHELTNLKLGDIDFEQRLVFISNGKGEKQRYVPLAKNIVPLLKEYRRRRSPQFEYLFANESALYGKEITGKLSSEFISKIFYQSKKNQKFEVKGLVIH